MVAAEGMERGRNNEMARMESNSYMSRVSI
jgi:hypothetical protein